MKNKSFVFLLAAKFILILSFLLLLSFSGSLEIDYFEETFDIISLFTVISYVIYAYIITDGLFFTFQHDKTKIIIYLNVLFGLVYLFYLWSILQSVHLAVHTDTFHIPLHDLKAVIKIKYYILVNTLIFSISFGGLYFLFTKLKPSLRIIKTEYLILLIASIFVVVTSYIDLFHSEHDYGLEIDSYESMQYLE